MKPLQPPSLLKLKTFERFKRGIRGKGILRKSDSIIIFVCGANPTPDRPFSRRKLFMDYAKKHLGNFRFFLAEEVFTTLTTPNVDDLLTIEDRLGGFSDCIIIFCESESAFAELGAFCLKDLLVEQVLIVNDARLKSVDSFINRGPIARADKRSKFKPTIQADFGSILRSAPEIKQRLESIIPHRRSHRIEFKEESGFSVLAPKDQLLLLADFIHLFGPVTTSELVAILKESLGVDIPGLDTELALGKSLGFFRRVEHGNGKRLWAPPSNESFSFFKYQFTSFRITDLRSEVVRFYFQKERWRLELATTT
jgi:hypothetical protein